MAENPLLRANIELSGEGLRRRMAAAERPVTPRPKAIVKPKKKKNLIIPKKKFVDARQARIDAAKAADLATIKARGLRSK